MFVEIRGINGLELLLGDSQCCEKHLQPRCKCQAETEPQPELLKMSIHTHNVNLHYFTRVPLITT